MPSADPLILLTFDVEEFDVPIEYGRPIAMQEQLRVGRVGFERVLDLLDQHPARPVATMFTTAVFAEAFPALMKRAASRHEIASHGYSHGPLMDGDLEKSRRILNEISGQEIRGFRRARMAPTGDDAIAKAGYRYNSSEHPTLLPGRYSNLRKPRNPYFSGDLLNIPVSVTPVLRVPMFWAAFKNFPLALVKRCAARTLSHDGAINFYWHPWEFADIEIYGLPRTLRAVQGQKLVERLGEFLTFLSTRGRFATFSEFDRRVRERSGKSS